MTAQALLPVSTSRVHGSTARGRWRLLLPSVLLVVAWVVLVLAVLLTDQRPQRAPVGLPDAGRVTAWAVMLTRTVVRLSAVGTVGCLVVAAWLLPREAGALPGDSPAHRRVLRAASRWAVAWAAASLLLMISVSAQLLGTRLPGALGSPALWAYVPELPEGRALMLSVPLVMLVAVHAGAADSRRALQTLTGVGLLALVPMALNGHAATAANHYLVTQSLVLHVLAVTLWTGGLVGLLHLRGAAGLETLAVAVRRFSPLALGCFVVVAISGLTSAGSRLGLDGQAWRSSYGALVVAKVLILVALAGAGVTHRRRTIPAIRAGRWSSFWALALGELVIMSVALGLAVALSRTAPPVRSSVVAAPHPSLRTIERGLEAPGPVRLLLEWRPDALVVTVVAVATVWYLLLVAGRTRWIRQIVTGSLWVLGGAVVLVWALCGGVAAYGSALLSGHVVQLLLCLVVVPRMVARGAALLRAERPDRASPPRPWLPDVDPLSAAVVMSLFLGAVYATPVLELSLRSPTAHLVVAALGLAVGMLCVLAATSSSSAQPRRRLDQLTALVLVTVAGGLLLTERPLAQEWFAELRWSWSDPVTDQRYAVATLLVVALVLLTTSRRSARLDGAGRPTQKSPRSI